MGVSAGTGLKPSSAGMSTLSSKASRSTPLEVDLDTRGAEAGREDVLHGRLWKFFFFQSCGVLLV